MRFFVFVALLWLASAANAQSARAFQLFDAGAEASKIGNHTEARKTFSDVLAIISREGANDQYFAKVYYNIGVSAYHLGDLPAAVSAYAKAETYSHFRYEKASYALGLAYAELGNYLGAEKAFRRALFQNRRNGETWFDVAFVYLRLNQREEARNAFSSAIKYRSVATAMSHNNLGVLLALEGHQDSAAKEFDQALKTAQYEIPEIRENIETIKRVSVKSSEIIATLDLKFSSRNNLTVE